MSMFEFKLPQGNNGSLSIGGSNNTSSVGGNKSDFNISGCGNKKEDVSIWNNKTQNSFGGNTQTIEDVEDDFASLANSLGISFDNEFDSLNGLEETNGYENSQGVGEEEETTPAQDTANWVYNAIQSGRFSDPVDAYNDYMNGGKKDFGASGERTLVDYLPSQSFWDAYNGILAEKIKEEQEEK